MLWQALPEPELDAESRAAFDTAYNNIRAFHEAQRAADVEVETMPGVRCRRITRPIGAPMLRRAQRALAASGVPAHASIYGRTGCEGCHEIFQGVSCTCDLLRWAQARLRTRLHPGCPRFTYTHTCVTV